MSTQLGLNTAQRISRQETRQQNCKFGILPDNKSSEPSPVHIIDHQLQPWLSLTSHVRKPFAVSAAGSRMLRPIVTRMWYLCLSETKPICLRREWYPETKHLNLPETTKCSTWKHPPKINKMWKGPLYGLLPIYSTKSKVGSYNSTEMIRQSRSTGIISKNPVITKNSANADNFSQTIVNYVSTHLFFTFINWPHFVAKFKGCKPNMYFYQLGTLQHSINIQILESMYTKYQESHTSQEQTSEASSFEQDEISFTRQRQNSVPSSLEEDKDFYQKHGMFFCGTCNDLMDPKGTKGQLLEFNCRRCGDKAINFRKRQGKKCMLHCNSFNYSSKKTEIDSKLIFDSTMPRMTVECPECYFHEAVYMVVSQESERRIILKMICARGAQQGVIKCGKVWDLQQKVEIQEYLFDGILRVKETADNSD